MTVGDLIDSINKIILLETELMQILMYPKDFPDSEQRVREIKTLIGIYRGEAIE